MFINTSPLNMASSIPMSELRDKLSCPICFEIYDDSPRLPKALPCLHTVCLDCLHKLEKQRKGRRGALQCRVCRWVGDRHAY